MKCPKLPPSTILTYLLIRHVHLDQKKFLFLNRPYLHLNHRQEVLPWHQLNSTPALQRHMVEFMLSSVTIRTSCSGRIWESTILYSGWVLTVKRDRDGKFQKCKARWVLRGFQDRQKDAQQTDNPTSTRPGLRLLCQNAPPMVGLSDTLTSRLRSFRGKVIHQIAMWSVSYLQKQGSRGTWQHG